MHFAVVPALCHSWWMYVCSVLEKMMPLHMCENPRSLFTLRCCLWAWMLLNSLLVNLKVWNSVFSIYFMGQLWDLSVNYILDLQFWENDKRLWKPALDLHLLISSQYPNCQLLLFELRRRGILALRSVYIFLTFFINLIATCAWVDICKNTTVKQRQIERSLLCIMVYQLFSAHSLLLLLSSASPSFLL